MSRSSRLAAAAALLALLITACGKEPTGTDPDPQTGDTVTQEIELPNVFAGAALGSPSIRTFDAPAAAAAVEIRKIRLTVRVVPSESIVFQKVYDVDPSAAGWKLPFSAPKGSTVRVTAELISVTGGVEKVEYSGRSQPVTMNPCPAAGCTPVLVPTYPGPVENLGASSITVTPDAKALARGESVQLAASVSPAGTYVVAWRSVNGSVASVSSTGMVNAVGVGTTQIVASVADKADTATVTVSAPQPVTIGSTWNVPSAPAGSVVTPAPSLFIRDAAGQPVSGYPVTFTVLSGGGTVTGASTTTNAQGVATVGSWTLGSTAGVQQLRGTAGNLSNTFEITATAANTCVETSYTLGATVTGAWTASDCLATSGSGRHFDMYTFTLTQQTAFRASITGPNGRRVNVRRAGTQDYVQLHASDAFMPPTSNPLEARYVLAAGSYVMEIATPDATTLGSYTLTTSTDATVTCTPLVYVTTGVTINEQLNSSDCAFNGGVEDRFILIAQPGVRLDLNLVPTGFAPVLVYRDDREGPASPTLASDVRTTVGVTAHVAYTTTFSGFSEIIVAHGTAATGSYTLTIGTASTGDTCVPIATSLQHTRLAVFEATDCAADGRIYDRYPLTVGAQTAFRTTLTSDATSKSTGIFAGSREVMDLLRTSGNQVVNWFLAPGAYELRVAAPAAAAGTGYTLATAAASELTCATNAASGGVTFSGSLGGSDCTFNGSFEDRVLVRLEGGQELVASMTTSAVGPAVAIRDPAATPGVVLSNAHRSTPGTVSAAVSSTLGAGYYEVIFTTDSPGTTGTYSGAITVR